VPKPELPTGDPGSDSASAARIEEHDIVVEGERIAATTYDRAKLKPGMAFAGPAIVTEFDSTTLVLPGYEAEVDRSFNILIAPTRSV
jgi:N-methylhydantoinase A